MPSTEYITKTNDRLDQITFDRYGSTDNDLVIFVIESNPGLENELFILRPGMKIVLPDPPVDTKFPVTTGQIFLWS